MQRELAAELRVDIGDIEIELQTRRRDFGGRGTGLRPVPARVDDPAG
ncbi:oxidoreductase [Mycobacterium tuberculosis]|nr:oxidoreductase [Mycobacterium tuberculosis]